MNSLRRFRIELLVWLLLLPFLASARKSPRGYRLATKRKQGRTLAKAKGGMDAADFPTSTPTFEPTSISTDDDDGNDDRVAAAEAKDVEKAEEKDNVKDDKNKNNDNGETDAPTSAPTFEPHTESPTLEPGVSGVEGNQETEEPTPTGTPTGQVRVETIEPTRSPVAQTLAPTMYPTIDVNTNADEKPVDPLPDESGSVPGEPSATESAETGPYPIRLEPLYMYVTMQGIANEGGFMDVLVDYMEYNMAKDFEEFESISYGVSTFSMITEYPAVSRNFDDNPISNVTVHIHLLTATFMSKPSDPDLVITEYMEMLLENEEMMQQYVDMQPSMDLTIHSVTLEFEDTIAPTNVQDNSNPNGAIADDETPEDSGSNIGVIIGWTVGAFAVLMWMVFLYGLQSRPTV